METLKSFLFVMGSFDILGIYFKVVKQNCERLTQKEIRQLFNLYPRHQLFPGQHSRLGTNEFKSRAALFNIFGAGEVVLVPQSFLFF